MAPRSVRYPVAWREGGGDPAAGELVVERDELRFDGARGGAREVVRVRFAEIADVHVARRESERLNGRPTIVLDRGRAGLMFVEPLGAGVAGEIAGLLTMLHAEGLLLTENVAVLVPLRRGAEKRAQELLEAGPPFDLTELGIHSHQVYVGDREAIFVFSGPDAGAVFERGLRDPALWKAGLAWRNVIAGQPRLLTCTFSWTAPVELL